MKKDGKLSITAIVSMFTLIASMLATFIAMVLQIW